MSDQFRGEASQPTSMTAAVSTTSQSASTSSADHMRGSVQSVFHLSDLGGVVLAVQNVVGTANLGVGLALEAVAVRARNAEYTPDRFNALILRIAEPKATCLAFSTGKIVVTGTKSEENHFEAVMKFARIIQKAGGIPTDKLSSAGRPEVADMKIINIVASADCGFPIQLEHLAFEHHKFAQYEPELFPGLIYRMKVPEVVFMIFVSGKVVVTGAKRLEHIPAAFTKIYGVLEGFRKQRNAIAALPIHDLPTSDSDLGPDRKRRKVEDEENF